ncbi:MAG: family transporter [Chitinophagaceae bacterium]|nr:family transporter [Chitinophagaceae bacterium]
MDQPTVTTLPGYVKFTVLLVGFSLLAALVSLGQPIIVPLVLALLFGILLNPVVNFLNKKWKVPNVIAVLISITLLFAFVGCIMLFVYYQVVDISEEWPKIKQNFGVHLKNTERWVQGTFHISRYKQEQYVQETAQQSLHEAEWMGNTLSSFTNTFASLILIPLYTFLILLYRKLFINFLTKVVNVKYEAQLIDILLNIGSIVQNYMMGLIIEMGIVATLTTTGLMILGVPYAILLGVVTAMLNLIPYIGILVAAMLTLVAAMINTTDPSMMLKIILLIWIIQLFDNNFLVPKIVGNKIKINALVSIVGVIVAGTLCGVAGMFLALPTIAILKVIFDRVESLKPYGYLIGDDLPKTIMWNSIVLPDLNEGGEKI